VPLSTTLLTTDTHRTGQLPEFIRNDQLPPDAPEPWTTMTGTRCWRSIQNPNQSSNSENRCRWSTSKRPHSAL